MAYTIQDIHNDILFLIDKEQNGHVSHEEIDSALHIAQIEKFNELLPLYGTSTTVNDILSPFSTKGTFTSSASGVVTLPTGLSKIVSLFLLLYNNTTTLTDRIYIEPVTEEQFPFRMTSQVLPVNSSYPIYVQRDAAVQVFPATTFNGEIIYLKEPTKPAYTYTQSGRTITYTGTTNKMEWRRTELNSIMYKAIEILGFNLNDVGSIQFSDKKSKENL